MIVLYIILACLLILTACYFLILVRPSRRGGMDTALICKYAHRGLFSGKIPENSLAAFEKACQNGVGIELDVQLSSDGTVMVFHDYTLLRMTGVDKKLTKLTKEELCKLSLKESDEKIPTLEQVLRLVDGRVPILVELKGESLDTALCPAVAKLLKEYGGKYCIESFNPFLLRAMRKQLPDAYYGQLYTNVCRDKKNYNPLNILLTGMCFNFLARPDFIAYNKKCKNSLPVRCATSFYGAYKFIWTIKKGDEVQDDESPIFEK